MSVVKYTEEKIKQCFLFPRSRYAAAIFLGCSFDYMKNLIREHRHNLVIGDWVLFEANRKSIFVPVYMWKIHLALEDKPKPVHPRASLSGGKWEVVKEQEEFEAAREQLRISLLLAQNPDEVKQAYRDYKADYQRVYRGRQKRLETNRSWFRELKASEARTRLLVRLRSQTPANTNIFAVKEAA